MTNDVQPNVIGIAYHYISALNWYNIRTAEANGDKFLHGHRDLVANSDNLDIPDWARQKFIFAFLNEPAPHSWTNNAYYPYVWEKLMKHISPKGKGVKLLRFNLTEQDDSFMLDRSYMEEIANLGTRVRIPKLLTVTITSYMDDEKIRIARLRYVQSRVPVSEYEGQHSLPELVIGNPISLERIVEVEGTIL